MRYVTPSWPEWTPDRPAGGLRERKKAKTFASIQQHALRLFREQGYAQTTIEQIAAEAEVSASTVFRYFPTKEALVLHDMYDPLLIAAFEAQPPEVRPIQALRRAVRTVFADLPADEAALQRERMALVRSVPELRASMLDEFIRTVQQIADLVAVRVGRRRDDVAVLTLAGALLGVMFAMLLSTNEEPAADFLPMLDAGLAYLEAGLPL
jgi:AcrR family transcriptional regulator